MKLKIMVLMLFGVAGVGASFALAEGGKHNVPCQWTHVFGTVSAPQTFTVTATKSREHGNVQPGQVVTVALGGPNQNVRFNGVGCVGTDGTVTVRGAELHVMPNVTPGGDSNHQGDGDGDHKPPTTTSTTTTTTTTRGGDGDHKPPTTTTATTTTTPGL